MELFNTTKKQKLLMKFMLFDLIHFIEKDKLKSYDEFIESHIEIIKVVGQ